MEHLLFYRANINIVLILILIVIGNATFIIMIKFSQVCRNGMVQHLEHLLFYGANMNARNASGNTPLHVCAVNNQVGCLPSIERQVPQ